MLLPSLHDPKHAHMIHPLLAQYIPETTSQITSCLQWIFTNLHSLHFQIVSKKFEHDRSRRTYEGLFAQKNICKVVDPEAVGFEEPVSSYHD